MGLIDEIKSDANAIALLKDWFGDGVPVTQEIANGRALVCLHGNAGGACPNHKAPKWWEKFFKDPIAAQIKRQIELKSRMKLETPYDKDLAMCSACGCCLQTKVWVPIEHVKTHTPPEVLDKMPSYCWQRREMDMT